MVGELRKWLATIRIGIEKQTAYKLNFLLLVIGPTLVFYFVKYNLWSSIFASSGKELINGYSLNTMLTYQGWVLVVSLLAHSFNGMQLGEDIRLGRISAYLIYPFQFWQYHFATFLSLQFIQLLVAGVTVASLSILVGFSHLQIDTLFQGVFFSMLVGIFWFVTQYGLSLLAFWLEQVWVMRVMFITSVQFLSGAVIPLDLYPKTFRDILDLTPFPYVTFVPVKIFMGEYQGSLLWASTILIGWITLCWLLAQLVWTRGLRMYTAAGM